MDASTADLAGKVRWSGSSYRLVREKVRPRYARRAVGIAFQAVRESYGYLKEKVRLLGGLSRAALLRGAAAEASWRANQKVRSRDASSRYSPDVYVRLLSIPAVIGAVVCFVMWINSIPSSTCYVEVEGGRRVKCPQTDVAGFFQASIALIGLAVVLLIVGAVMDTRPGKWERSFGWIGVLAVLQQGDQQLRQGASGAFRPGRTHWTRNTSPASTTGQQSWNTQQTQQGGYGSSQEANQSDRTGRQCDMPGCTNPGVRWHGTTCYCGIHIRAITGQ